jgi:hypothetical protein
MMLVQEVLVGQSVMVLKWKYFKLVFILSTTADVVPPAMWFSLIGTKEVNDSTCDRSLPFPESHRFV